MLEIIPGSEAVHLALTPGRLFSVPPQFFISLGKQLCYCLLNGSAVCAVDLAHIHLCSLLQRTRFCGSFISQDSIAWGPSSAVSLALPFVLFFWIPSLTPSRTIFWWWLGCTVTMATKASILLLSSHLQQILIFLSGNLIQLWSDCSGHLFLWTAFLLVQVSFQSWMSVFSLQCKV